MAQSAPSGANPLLWNSYTKQTEIGQGPIAKVFKAKELETNTVLVVKVFNRLESKSEDDERRLGIRNEARILNKIRNGPNVITAGVALFLNKPSQNVELPMEYYKDNLASMLKRTEKQRGFVEGVMVAPSWYDVVLIQMIEALNYLQQEQIAIIHRNIAPENILANEPNHFVLAGFFHARPVLPPPDGYCDNIQFMAPEMYEGQKQTFAVDMWSLGMVCLDMLDWLPPTRGVRTVSSNREAHWCNAMHVLANELQDFKPEIMKMVRNEPRERMSPIQLFTFLEGNVSTKRNRMRPSQRLTLLKIKKNLGPGVPESAVSQAVVAYLREHGLSEEGRNPPPQPPTRRTVTVTTGLRRSTPIQSAVPIPHLPGRGAIRASSTRRGVLSLPKTMPSTRSQNLVGSSTLAAMKLPAGSRRTAGLPGSGSNSTLLSTRSQEVDNPSNAVPKSFLIDTKEAAYKERLAPRPRKPHYQSPERPPRAADTLSLAPEEGVERPCRTDVTKTPESARGMGRPYTTAASSASKSLQEGAGPSIRDLSPSNESRGSSKEQQVSPRRTDAKKSEPSSLLPRQPQPQSRDSPRALASSHHSKDTDSRRSTSSSTGSSKKFEQNRKPNKSETPSQPLSSADRSKPTSSSPETSKKNPNQRPQATERPNSSRPLSVNAAQWFPPGHTGLSVAAPQWFPPGHAGAETGRLVEPVRPPQQGGLRPPVRQGQPGGFQDRRPVFPGAGAQNQQGWNAWVPPPPPPPRRRR